MKSALRLHLPIKLPATITRETSSKAFSYVANKFSYAKRIYNVTLAPRLGQSFYLARNARSRSFHSVQKMLPTLLHHVLLKRLIKGSTLLCCLWPCLASSSSSSTDIYQAAATECSLSINCDEEERENLLGDGAVNPTSPTRVQSCPQFKSRDLNPRLMHRPYSDSGASVNYGTCFDVVVNVPRAPSARRSRSAMRAVFPAKHQEVARTIAIPDYAYVDILSLRKKRVLVGDSSKGMLDIYNAITGCVEKKFDLKRLKQPIKDAVWLSRDSILVSHGDWISVIPVDNAQPKEPPQPVTCSERFTLLDKGWIYLADRADGVFKFRNESIYSKKFKFRTRDCGRCTSVVKTVKKCFWTIESFDDQSERLRKYDVTSGPAGAVVTEIDVDVKFDGAVRDRDTRKISLRGASMATYDNGKYVCLSEKEQNVIHIFKHNGAYVEAWLNAGDDIQQPSRLAINSKRKLLYVGQFGQIKVYDLIFP